MTEYGLRMTGYEYTASGMGILLEYRLHFCNSKNAMTMFCRVAWMSYFKLCDEYLLASKWCLVDTFEKLPKKILNMSQNTNCCMFAQ